MKICARCGKGPHTIITRSHSMVASRRRQKPNLQRARWQGQRVWLCTRCKSAVNRTKPAPGRPEAVPFSRTSNLRGVA